MTHLPNYQKMRNFPLVLETFEKRSAIVRGIRDFFFQKKFLEVETPLLVKLPGMEPYLDVFKTKFQSEREFAVRTSDPESAFESSAGTDMYLITSPEYAMKKLLVGGMERIFQITRSFRNKETGGPLHNPEFTMIEWYRASADYTDIMRDTEELFMHLCRVVHGQDFFMYQGARIDLSDGFERIRVREAFETYAGISREIFEDERMFIEEVCARGYRAESYDDAFFLLFLNEIEAKLGRERPTILYEYPLSMAALSRACPDNPKYAERFEVYCAGMELANAFSELTDAEEQERRLVAERAERARLEKEAYAVDESFLEALRLGMPPSGGIALGVDRLVMLLLDKTDIADVVLFPFRDL